MPRRALFTKEEMVKKALDLVRRKGIDALTARELGARLGCSSRPIFTVFNSMEDVSQAVRQAAQQLFSDYVADVNLYTPAFKEFGMRLVRFARKEQNLFQLLFLHKDESVTASIYPEVTALLSEICEEYGITHEQASLLYGQLWVFVCGLAVLTNKDVEAYPDDVVSVMISMQFLSTLSFIKSGKQLVSPIPHLRSEDEPNPQIMDYFRDNNN